MKAVDHTSGYLTNLEKGYGCGIINGVASSS